MQGYLREFRIHWRTLAAAGLGLGLGIALNHYVTALFAPHLLKEFGWSRSQFALVGALPLITMVFVPFAGRLTDRIGARKAGMIGFAALPLGFLGFSFMSGSLWEFFAIYLLFSCFGILTSSMVFCRAVVERFETARGMALSVAMTASPAVGALAVPVVGEIIAQEGWRTAYRFLAFACATGGLLAIVLMGRQAPGKVPDRDDRNLTRADLLAFARNPMFRLLILGMFLCNLPQVIVSSQLKLVMLENGATMEFAMWMVSVYALSVIAGRFASGLALDIAPAHIVAVLALGLPALGYAVLASHVDAGWLLVGAVLLVGLAQGAEGDIGAYIVSRRFDMRNYSLVMGLVIATMAGASAAGSLLLSYSLHLTDSFAPFLGFAAVATVAGAAMFLTMGRHREQAAMMTPMRPAAAD